MQNAGSPDVGWECDRTVATEVVRCRLSKSNAFTAGFNVQILMKFREF